MKTPWSEKISAHHSTRYINFDTQQQASDFLLPFKPVPREIRWAFVRFVKIRYSFNGDKRGAGKSGFHEALCT